MNHLLSTPAMPEPRAAAEAERARSLRFRFRTWLAVASPLAICLVVCGAFLVWFSTSTARMLEAAELRSQGENVTLLANYLQHFIDDLDFDVGLVAERVAGQTPSLADLAGLRGDFHSASHIRAYAIFDADGHIIMGDRLPETLTALLPGMAARMNAPVFLPLAADTRSTGDDIPDLIFARRLRDGVNVVFDLTAASSGRSENVRTTNVDAAFAMVDTDTMTSVAFGAGNREQGWSQRPVAALAQAVATPGANHTRCEGNILIHRHCVTFHRLANSSIALVELVGGNRLHQAWVAQSRPVWLFAACVMAGGLVSSILVGLWAHQRRDDRHRLAAALEDARRAYAAKSNFMAHLSHEFFTPLNSIIGFSELMRKALFGPIGDPYAGYVDDIHTSAVHLQNIASDIMDAERIERGKLIVGEGKADLNVTAADAKRILSVFASKQSVAIDVVPWLRPASVGMDPHRALQVTVNLLSNAVKYSEPGDRVIVAVEKRDGGFALTVTDHGIGMTREEIAYTEQPFGHPADRRKGRHDSIGLGLPIVRGLLAAVGGRLTIASEKHRGTTVSAFFGASKVS